jgi:hypothetical protein
MARGVYTPGQTGADDLAIDGGALGRFRHLPNPIMYHNWLDTTLKDTNDLSVATGWDIKVRLLLTGTLAGIPGLFI